MSSHQPATCHLPPATCNTIHVLPRDIRYQDYVNIAAEAYAQRQAIVFSHDVVQNSPTAVLWNIPPTDRQRYTDWYRTHHPNTTIQFESQDFVGALREAPAVGLCVDVSHHQGAIDWNIMKEQGVTHCYIRASYGTKLSDSRYRTNVAGATKAGIKFGAYHFFIYGAGGSEQARFFYDIIKDDPGHLPPAIDFEKTDQISAPDPSQLRSCLTTVANLTGRVPVIYTNIDSWYDLPAPQSWAARYPLWVACWTDRDRPFIPRDWDTYWLWQYGQTNGRPFGVQSAQIDLNRFNPGTAGFQPAD